MLLLHTHQAQVIVQALALIRDFLIIRKVVFSSLELFGIFAYTQLPHMTGLHDPMVLTVTRRVPAG